MTSVRRRPRTTVTVLVLLGCWVLGLPGSVTVLAVGLLVIALAVRRLARPVYVVRRRPRIRRFAIVAVVGLLMVVAGPPAAAAAADPIGPGLPTASDYCRLAPPAETPGAGVAGFLDPQQDLPFDGTAYGDHGYAGFFWWSYDPGCVNSVTQLVGIQSPWDASGASQSTQVGNWLLGGAVLLDAWATGMRARALDPDTFSSLDAFMSTVASAGYAVLVQPWVWLPLVMLGLTVLALAIRGNLPEVLRRVTAALAGLVVITVAAAAPMDLIRSADQALVDAQQRIDTEVFSRLPADVLPQIQHCQFDQTAMYEPRFDENGLLKVAGTACTTKYTPDPKDPAYGDYVSRWLYPEVLVRNTIQRYWQQGMIGSQNLTGPDAELGARFLNGQAVNLKQPDLTKIQQNAPAGAVWCTYQDNQQVCGRSEKPGPPGNVVAATEAEYRSAIQDAGDAIYPYIQGRAGNRTAAGFSALTASAAAAPFPAAAYTAVLTARLLLRLGLIAGLFVGIGMMVRPHLAQRVLNVIAGSLLVVLLFSCAGALMTYLSMVMLSPTTVGGYQLDPTAGVIILALASVLAWLLTRPIKRITGMLSYAATGNPHQLSEQRRRAMAGLGRLTPLPRWRRGRSHRVSDPQENPTDTVMPTEPARPSRPEQATTVVRRRNTKPRLAPPTIAPSPGPKPVAGRTPVEPPTTRFPRIRPATAADPTPTVGRDMVDDPTRAIPVAGIAIGSSAPTDRRLPAEERSAGSHIHRQVWTGHRWVLADDDRVFRPADPDHRPVRPRAGRAGRIPATRPAALGRPRPARNPNHPLAQHRRRPEEEPMNTRNAWRWPLRSRGRLIALVLAGLALALITKTILDNATSTAAPNAAVGPATGSTTATTTGTKPTAVPTNPAECVALWAKGPDRDACLYREYGYTPSPEPTRNQTARSSTTPVVIGIPLTTTIEGGGSGYLPEADRSAALDVAARFVDAWYAGGSDQAWRDQVSRWADPTLAEQLRTLNRDVLPGSRRVTDPAMRAFQPGLASIGVATNNGSLALTVIYTDAGWRVVTVTTEAP